jgi:hypothetical protein
MSRYILDNYKSMVPFIKNCNGFKHSLIYNIGANECLYQKINVPLETEDDKLWFLENSERNCGAMITFRHLINQIPKVYEILQTAQQVIWLILCYSELTLIPLFRREGL